MRLRVEDILEAIVKIEQYVSDLSFEQFQEDQKTVDAVVRNLEVIGEAVRHLATDQENLPAPASRGLISLACVTF